MKLSPLQTLVLLVVLAGIIYGTYSATMAQLPDLTGSIVGNTTSSENVPNGTVATYYIQDDTNTTNTSVFVMKNTKIYVEKEGKQVKGDLKSLSKGTKIEVYTIGDPTNTIPPQVTADRIIVKVDG